VSGQWEYARLIARIESRVTSVERRLRDAIGSAIKFFIDLEDVKARTDALPSLTEGQVWGINANGEWDIITPAGSGGGAYASLSYNGLYDGALSGEDSEWEAWSHGDYTLTAITAPGVGIGAGIEVTEPGVYRVWASAHVTSGSGTPVVSIIHHMTDGWTVTGDANTCRDPVVTLDDAAGGGSASILLPLHPDFAAVIDVDLGGADEVRWRLQVEWAHPLAVEPGTCGG